nr:MAG TPA: hypothetical protein [Caudoviricetes sp.]
MRGLVSHYLTIFDLHHKIICEFNRFDFNSMSVSLYWHIF